jgi:translocation and assembly module TamB
VSPYVGTEVRFAGQGSSPISYQGPLALDGAQARAGLSWTRGEAYGFLMGPGQLSARLSGGMLQIEPLDVPVSEGRVRLAAQVRLAPEPMEVFVQPGRVADGVRINPRMCAGFLQYIAPVLAGVATAEGRFSIELDRCRIPLDDPTQSELAGRMIIHSVQVGPGPLVQEMAVLLGRATPAQLTRESVIPFQLAGGRVYHRDLVLAFPDLTVRTSGSVGLDQTVDIMAEMPIPPKWLGSNELVSSALRNQRIRVPIAGTLSRPQIDRKTLDRLSQQFLDNAARNVLQDGLNRGMQQLLGPAPPVR